MVAINQEIPITIDSWTTTIKVQQIETCPFGATLPEGFHDVTDAADQAQGIRVGVKGIITGSRPRA